MKNFIFKIVVCKLQLSELSMLHNSIRKLLVRWVGFFCRPFKHFHQALVLQKFIESSKQDVLCTLVLNIKICIGNQPIKLYVLIGNYLLNNLLFRR